MLLVDQSGMESSEERGSRQRFASPSMKIWGPMFLTCELSSLKDGIGFSNNEETGGWGGGGEWGVKLSPYLMTKPFSFLATIARVEEEAKVAASTLSFIQPFGGSSHLR